MDSGLPEDGLAGGLIASGSSPVFDRDSLPDALQREHSLAENFWAVLCVLAGSVQFEDLETGRIRQIAAPGRQVIRPRAPHRLIADTPLRCRIDFYKTTAAPAD
jgi:tellurite resistance-related uncharacterized protein